MIFSFKNKNEYYLPAITISLSVAFHIALIVLTIFLYRFREEGSFGNGDIEIGTIRGSGTSEQSKSRKIQTPDYTEEKNAEENKEEKELNTTKQKGNDNQTNSNGNKTTSSIGNGYGDLESVGTDTASLTQYYHESSLNVRMKYPLGWVFIDQKRKNKLDGITFWLSSTVYNPPPYIHVEVVDKYMFNPQKYKYNFEGDNYTGYYNDPEEMENQITRIIYLKTEDDNDFIIKLIMNNPEDFKAFQPTFFAIVKSFKFGNLIF